MFSRAAATIFANLLAAEGTTDLVGDLAKTRRSLADWMEKVGDDPVYQRVFEACQEFDSRFLAEEPSSLALTRALAEPCGGAPPTALASPSASASASASASTLPARASASTPGPTAAVALTETPRKRPLPPDDPGTPPKDDGAGQTFIE